MKQRIKRANACDDLKPPTRKNAAVDEKRRSRGQFSPALKTCKIKAARIGTRAAGFWISYRRSCRQGFPRQHFQ